MMLLGLDVGTTGCKALVVDPGGKIAGHAFREYGIAAGPNGKAEQDAENVWMLAKIVMHDALEAAGRPAVAALSISAQGDAVVPVNAKGRALHPAILGMDYRCRSEIPECARLFDGFDLFRRTGMRPHPINSFLKMLWLRRGKSEIFAQADRLVSYSGFLMGRMGCLGVDDITMASRSMAYNLSERRWDEDILDAFHFPRELLPKVVPSLTAVGRMDQQLADSVGFVGQPPLIVAGGHDQPVCAVGAGVVNPQTAVVTTDTAEVLSRYLPEPILVREMYESYYPCYCSAMGEGYFTFALNHVGGLALRWLRDTWCEDIIRQAADAGRDSYDILIESMPKRLSTVFVLPYFNGSGTPYCDLSARAAFVGMTMDTDRSEIALALLEGLTFDLRLNLDRMAELGITTDRIRNVGGGSRSRRWLQLKADILGIPVDRMENADAGCIGAAIVAGAGSGIYASVAEGVQRLVRPAESFEPVPQSVSAYAERFAAYRELCAALTPFYRKKY